MPKNVKSNDQDTPKNIQSGDMAFTATRYVMNTIMFIVGLSGILMIALALVVSFSDERSILQNGFSFFPSAFSLDAYKLIFQQNWVINAYIVTVFVTVVGTFASVLLSAMGAYAISSHEVKYRNFIALFFYIPMLFSSGLIPWYLWVTQGLHLKNTIWALILPSLISPFWIFMMRNYFKTIPQSLSEAASIDGASVYRIFFTIIFPLSKPIIATVSLFMALGYWNNYTNALWLIDKQELFPLQYMLYKIQALMSYQTISGGGGQNITINTSTVKPTSGVQMATFIITLGPIVLLYPFVQKHFIKGIMVGAVKG